MRIPPSSTTAAQSSSSSANEINIAPEDEDNDDDEDNANDHVPIEWDWKISSFSTGGHTYSLEACAPLILAWRPAQRNPRAALTWCRRQFLSGNFPQ
ncbi:hypothetical protein RP20_CCG020454 [Aedes albopictus]|nr:hypothetical protein RP20_CCG020454 [Aedes albopictus]